MSNRAQRRAAAKKRPGQTYADVLAQKKMIREVVEKSTHDRSVAIEADIKAQRSMWMAVVALNRAFGFGGKRSRLFLATLEEVAAEAEEMAKENGAVYAVAKLMEAASKILETELTPVWEEEMRAARLANEAEGVYFPEDDPDKW